MRGKKRPAQGRGRRWAKAGAIICFLIAVVITVLTVWYVNNFDTSLAGLLYSLTIPQKGTGTGAVIGPAKQVAPWIILIFCIYLLLLFLFSEKLWKRIGSRLRNEDEETGKGKKQRLETIRRRAETALTAAGIASLIVSLIYSAITLDLPDYLQRLGSQTKIYEQEYAAPESSRLTAPEDRPNLIMIYLESMETTYASSEEGGIQPVNYMPGLTRLAHENISFSNSDRLGGIRSTNNTNWTMAALFASTSGLPFAFPVEQNAMVKYAAFAPEIVTLGDILEEQGYTQEFLCGSDGEYGGRALYFREHGSYGIYDLWKAREEGDIPQDYYVWWGFEDRILFRIAKNELTRLEKSEEPFNLTLLTVDAHHLGGFVCEECGDEYDDPTANVIACTDRQVTEFVEWCSRQPFWDNTVLVITGDHPRMDTCLTEGVSFQDRTIYNCFMNARKEPESGTQFRESTMMDMYPTVLSAMGWEIEGDRLGLGTDLFSGTETLAERIGYETLNDETQKYSSYFMNHFAR